MSKYSLIGVFLQALFCSLLWASDASSQKISIEQIYLRTNWSELKVEDAFREIQQQTGFLFAYNQSIIRPSMSVSLQAEKATLGNVLREIATQTGLDFKRVNGNIHVSRSSRPDVVEEGLSAPEQGVVRGTVRSAEDNQPLPGVSIIIKGTSNGTTTDLNGQYSISVNNDATLQFSYIGFQTQELLVNNQSVIDVMLLVDQSQLEEVVVVGYGTQAKRDLTGSVSSVKSEEIRNMPLTSLDQAMQGRAAGVQVTQNSGAPGGAVSVRIRGVSTASGNNEPLYVIDGFPIINNNGASDNAVGTGQASNALASLNPNEIESIEILKDAAAAAVYGTRASNGVVLITTKRGKEGRARVEFDSYVGTQNRWRKLDLLNSREFAQLANEAYTNANQPLNPFWSGANANAPLASDGSGPFDTDWQDVVFRQGLIQNYNLTVSGGSEKTKAAFTLNMFDQEGILIASDFRRYSLRTNVDHRVNDKLKFGTSLSVSTTNQTGVQTDNFDAGILQTAYQMYPMEPARRPDGTPAFIPLSFPNGSNNGLYYPRQLQNPILRAEYGQDNFLQRTRLLGTAFGEYEIVKGLRWKTNVGTDLIYGNRENWTPFLPASIAGVGQTLNNSLYKRNAVETSWLVENTLSYFKTVGKHSFDVVVGSTAQYFKTDIVDVNANNFPSNDVRAISQAQQNVAGGRQDEVTLASYLGRLNYSFNDKYLFSAVVRADGSSRFGDGNKWGVFPALSAGWRLSQESFLSGIDVISDLKLRGSWGRLGNQEIGLYRYLSTYGGGFGFEYTFGTGDQQPAPGIGPTALGNPDIRWETTEQYNIGLDGALFNNKLTFTAEYFVRNTFDILLNVPVPANLGAPGNVVTRNTGEIQNRGFEFSAGYQGNIGEFQWGISGNVTTLQNEVISLGEGRPLVSGFNVGGAQMNTRTEAGQPLAYFWALKTDGLFRSQAEIDAANERARQISGNPSAVFQAGVVPGDRRFVDVDGNGVINQNDRTYLGKPIPGLLYGLNLNAAYKGFDFSLFLQGVSDVEVANMTRRQLYDIRNFNGQGAQNVTREMLNRWTPQNTNTDIPRITYNTTPNNIQGSDFYVENGAFLRARNVQLGYTLPTDLVKRIGVERARFYVSAQNLFTITNYTGYDPEIGDFNQNALQSRFDLGTYPQPRTFLAGFNLQF